MFASEKDSPKRGIVEIADACYFCGSVDIIFQ
jgi:hypothetical protein